MKTMDTMCNTHKKYRPALSASSFYQPDYYSRTTTLRPQSEYGLSMVGSGLGGSGAWAGSRAPRPGRGRRVCSACLGVAALLAALAVFAVAALAFYMGALRPDSTDPIIAFSCSVSVTRGDVWAGAGSRARRYAAALRAVLAAPRARTAPALAGLAVTRFGEAQRDVHFRLYLDRRKIPSTVSNVEEAIKDAIVQDMLSRKPLLGQIRVDPGTIIIKRDLEHSYHSESQVKAELQESLAAAENIPSVSPQNAKEQTIHTRMGVIRKTTIKPNLTIPGKKRPSMNEEPEINTENLPVIQGSFQITKTDADITENRLNTETRVRQAEKNTTRIMTTTEKPKVRKNIATSQTPAVEETTTSPYMKTTPQIVMHPEDTKTTDNAKSKLDQYITVMESTTQNLVSDIVSYENRPKDLPKIDTLFVPPPIIDDEPWRPIRPNGAANMYHITSERIEPAPIPMPKAEDRIGVAEVVEDVDSMESVMNSYQSYPMTKDSVSNLYKDSPQPQRKQDVVNDDEYSVADDGDFINPYYTSFNDPTFSSKYHETETLGSNYPKPHPIPVDKLATIVAENQEYPTTEVNEQLTGTSVSIKPTTPSPKLSSVSMNVLHSNVSLDIPAEVVDNGIVRKYNDTTNRRSEEMESRMDEIEIDEIPIINKVTEKYLGNTHNNNRTNVQSEVRTTTSPSHLTWEFVNGSETNWKNIYKNSPQKFYNETLQAIITRNDAPFPNTTPKFSNRLSILRNISDIIDRYTSETTKGSSISKYNPLNISQQLYISNSHPQRHPVFDEIQKSTNNNSSRHPDTIVTLLPAKSNSGVNRPLRPRPKFPKGGTVKGSLRDEERSLPGEVKISSAVDVEQNYDQSKMNDKVITTEETVHFLSMDIEATTPIEPLNVEQEFTTILNEIITAAESLEDTFYMDEKNFFFTNVTDNVKVVDKESENNTKNLNDVEVKKVEENARYPKTHEDLKSKRNNISKTVFQNTDDNLEDTNQLASTEFENIELTTLSYMTTVEITKTNFKYGEDEPDNMDKPQQLMDTFADNNTPNGTVKVEYQVSTSVSSKISNITKNLSSSKVSIVPNIVKRNTSEEINDQLSPDQLKLLASLASLATIDNNNQKLAADTPDDTVISTKAVSSSYTVNNAGFKIPTKTLNKIPVDIKGEEKKFNKFLIETSYTPFHESVLNASEQELTSTCDASSSFACSDGLCLPLGARCNRLLECARGEDEAGCACADYLRAERDNNKICDGVVDCADYSDENQCEWCTPGAFVCAEARSCVSRTRVCDGVRDCPLGDDERACVALDNPNLHELDEQRKSAPAPLYDHEGFLSVRKAGVWGRLCVSNFDRVVAKSHSSLQIADLGRAVCRAMTYQDYEEVERASDISEEVDNVTDGVGTYYELQYRARPTPPHTSLSFRRRRGKCARGQLLRVTCRDLECGIRPQHTDQQPRIVGGLGARAGDWPWQAALYKEGEFQCGATLLADRWLLSAGHCFYQAEEEYWVARVGAVRRGDGRAAPYEQRARVSQVVLHPRYEPHGFVNDVALVRTARAFRPSAHVRPACLPRARDELADGRRCTVLGWGQLHEVGRIFPDTLQEVELPVVSAAECRRRTLFLPLYRVTDDMLCAGYERGGRDACLGDSGGPLLCLESDNHWYIYGVTSNGYGCARPNRPGVYTKVSNYVDWIEDTISQNDTDEDEDPAPSNRKPLQARNTTSNGAGARLLNDSGTRGRGYVDRCRGHRCPLGECLPPSRVCNGFIECQDGSDEMNCPLKL